MKKNQISMYIPTEVALAFYGMTFQQGFVPEAFQNFCEILKSNLLKTGDYCTVYIDGTIEKITEILNTIPNVFAAHDDVLIVKQVPELNNFLSLISKPVGDVMNNSVGQQIETIRQQHKKVSPDN